MGVIFFCLATRVHLILEDGWKRYFGRWQVGKRTCTIFIKVKHQRLALTGQYMNKEGRA